jgi:hypothetical protein
MGALVACNMRDEKDKQSVLYKQVHATIVLRKP